MPYPNEHSARVKDPDGFQPESFRRKNIAPGIDLVMGKPKGSDAMTAQAYRFDAQKFTAAEAKAWLSDHKIEYISFEAAAGKAIGMRFGPNSAIKAVADGDEWKLRVLGVPFGSMDHKDFDGQWFTDKTNIMMNKGEKRPAMYYHGRAPNGQMEEKPEAIGTAEYVDTDEQGHWFDVVLDKGKKWAKRIWDAARRGLTYASTGAIAHLFRGNDKGEIGMWPIGEISLLDKGQGRAPANWDAVAMPMKSVFNDAGLEMPESFVEADEAETDEVAEEDPSVEQIIAEEIEMAPLVVASAASRMALTKGH